MSRKAKEIVFVLDSAGNKVTDANGIAVQTLTVRVTRKDKPKDAKGNHPKEEHKVQCPHFESDDISFADDEETSATVVLPAEWDLDRFLKALNQGTRLLAQQPVHAKFAPGGEILANRALVYKFMAENPDDADVKALQGEFIACNMRGDVKAGNSALDKFFSEFLIEESE